MVLRSMTVSLPAYNVKRQLKNSKTVPGITGNRKSELSNTISTYADIVTGPTPSYNAMSAFDRIISTF
jgi:hypothetical protein